MAESKLSSDPEPLFRINSFGRTWFNVMVFSYRWDIENFMSLPIKGGEYCEISIPTDDQSATHWYLRVYPNGRDAYHKDYVSVYVCNWSHQTVKTRYSMELKDGSDNLIVSRNTEYAEVSPKSEHGFTECIERDTLQKALENSINGTLTILCTIKEFTKISTVEGPSNRPIKRRKHSHSTNVLKTLLTDQACSDFTINVKGRQFKVHKAILHTCSPVFATMFSTEMKEKAKNEATVDDVDPDVFEKIVEFMYTGTVVTINDVAMELVPVANKYILKELLEQCEAVLCSQVSMDVAIKLLKLSNLYSLEYLKNEAMKYIKANLKGMSQTADWKTYVANDPELLTLFLMG